MQTKTAITTLRGVILFYSAPAFSYLYTWQSHSVHNRSQYTIYSTCMHTRMWIGWLHWFPPPMSVAQSQLLFRIKMSNEEREKKYFYYVACIILVVRWFCFAYSLAPDHCVPLSRTMLTLSLAQCFSCKYFEIFIANCDNIMREASTQFHSNAFIWMENMIIRIFVEAHVGEYISVWRQNQTHYTMCYFTLVDTFHSPDGIHTHTLFLCPVHTYQQAIIFRKHYFIWQRCSNKMTYQNEKQRHQRASTFYVGARWTV